MDPTTPVAPDTADDAALTADDTFPVAPDAAELAPDETPEAREGARERISSSGCDGDERRGAYRRWQSSSRPS